MKAILIGIGVVMFVTLLMIALTNCGGELFPKCNDPKHPCPDVRPDYPPGPSFGHEGGAPSSYDAGTEVTFAALSIEGVIERSHAE